MAEEKAADADKKESIDRSSMEDTTTNIQFMHNTGKPSFEL